MTDGFIVDLTEADIEEVEGMDAARRRPVGHFAEDGYDDAEGRCNDRIIAIVFMLAGGALSALVWWLYL